MTQTKKPSATDPRVPLPSAHADARGAIQPIVEGGIHSIQVITSKKDTVRANHYHKEDSHFMYVVSGAFQYYWRPAGDKAPPQSLRVPAGQMVHTPPLVEHAVHFLEDTVFLNITSEARDQSTYEADIVRVKLFALEDKADGDHAGR